MKFYRSADLRVENKVDDSPLTQADLAAHEIIFSELSKISNEIIISEESDLNKTLDLKSRKFWLVDPLDGTRDFIAGKDTFCVSIALIESSKPILGVLYSPAKDELFFASKGEGSFFNGKKIFNSSDRKNLLGLASGAIHPSPKMMSFLKAANIEKLTRYGSALKFGHLATGEADVYPRFGETSEWDTAAGQIICTEAGCDVIDIKTLQPLSYTKSNFRNSGFIALRKDLIPQFNKILTEIKYEFSSAVD